MESHLINNFKGGKKIHLRGHVPNCRYSALAPALYLSVLPFGRLAHSLFFQAQRGCILTKGVVFAWRGP